MRDRLVELISAMTCPNNICKPNCDKCENVPLTDKDVELIAYAILADGWVRPPCKVGDVVYMVMDVETVHRQMLEMEVIGIEIGHKNWICLKTTRKYRFNFGKATFEDFGKTVFLTREEAEKAMMGGESDA